MILGFISAKEFADRTVSRLSLVAVNCDLMTRVPGTVRLPLNVTATSSHR